jgi:hypothetical protein
MTLLLLPRHGLPRSLSDTCSPELDTALRAGRPITVVVLGEEAIDTRAHERFQKCASLLKGRETT